MRTNFWTCSILTTLAFSTALAGPLDKRKISGDARWLLHLDMESFRGSKVGAFVVDKILQPKLEASEPAKKLNLSLNFKNISSITAYGPEFKSKAEGVLLLETSADVKKDLDALVGLSALSADEKKKAVVAQTEPYLLYSINEELFVAPGIGNAVLLARSREQIEQARSVLLGKRENLQKAAAFNDFPKEPGGFFFLGMAEGFNEETPIPPQAQVLRETRGGRLVIGENEADVFLDLVFKGKDDESTSKIQQVFQGIVALATLSRDNKDLNELGNAAKVTASGRNVTVNLRLPIARTIEKIEEKVREKSDPKNR